MPTFFGITGADRCSERIPFGFSRGPRQFAVYSLRLTLDYPMSRYLLLVPLFVACTPDQGLTYKQDQPIDILPGTISGRVCDPSGRTWLADATAYVNIADTSGVIYDTVTATSDTDGRWLLADLPGEVEYQVYVQYGSDILLQESVWVGSGDTVELDEPDCFDPLSLDIAIVTGDYDNFDVVLNQLGFANYTTIDGLDTPTLAGFVGDPAALAAYDMIFFNGGHQEDGVIYNLLDPSDPVVAQNVQNLVDYVEAGGIVYASDWAYDDVERMFPDRVDFVGADEIPNDAQKGDYQLVNAAVSDASLAEYLGKDYIDVQYDLPVWPPIEAVSSSVSTHLSGTVPYSDGMSEYTLTSVPLLVSYNAGQGKVVYSTFRVVPNASTDLLSMFQYMMYNL